MYYFAYGSNMNHKQIAHICPSAVFVGTARLGAHTVIYDVLSAEEGPVANLVEKRQGEVIGALYDISTEALAELDEFEGYPDYYQRKSVTVFCVGKLFEAVTYYRYPCSLGIPEPEYLNTVMQGALDCSVPLDYIKSVLTPSALD